VDGVPIGSVSYTYHIGQYEVTAGQYCEFLNAAAASDTYGLYDAEMMNTSWGCRIKQNGVPGSFTYSVPSDWANRPVNIVDWGDAARFCNWLTNGQPRGSQGLSTTEDGSYYLNGATTDSALLAVTRKADARCVLPTHDEWFKAAYYDPNKPGGAGYWDYPTRTNAAPSNVLSSTGANNANFEDKLRGPTIGLPYYRTEVGAFANSPGPYGTYDQGGNVNEWNETVWYSLWRGIRGGGWGDYGPNALCATHNGRNRPSLSFIDGGFRVACVPEPTTLGLLSLGCVVALWRARAEQAGR
jgi:formylglycine-generating enzyme required for sulfatase activity